MSRIAVVDLGTGNLHSVSKALERVAPDREVVITSNPVVIRAAGHVVLPGQGAIGTWFRALSEKRLHQAIADALATRPVLGICLGLQALYSFSEENEGTQGFGFLTGSVHRFPSAHKDNGLALKVPHMGWNNVSQINPHSLWQGIVDNSRFYFVHSYYGRSTEPAEVAGTTTYGLSFTSAAARENVFAVQFHPEKSHYQGLMFLENFVQWDGST